MRPSYILIIDGNDGIWFTGKIVIDYSDTLFIDGFEKGNIHPTSVKQLDKLNSDEIILGNILIWTKGLSADTIELDNYTDSIRQLPIHLNLYMNKKLWL